MTTHRPLISVIIPAYNAAAFLADAVDSIRRQAYQPLEIIIVDDGSTDGTAEVAARLGGEVRYVRQPNGGPAVARNHGLRLARGEVIAFLDADDVWPDGRLEVQLERLLAEPQLQIVLGMVRYVRLPGARHPKFPMEDQEPGAHSEYLGASLFRREVFETVGPFDEALPAGEDLDWIFRAREAGLSIAGVKHVTLHYRLHATNMTLGRNVVASALTRSFKRRLDRSRQAGQNYTPLRPLADYYDGPA